MILQEKPKQIEAVQFKGGLDSAREVIEFAYAREYEFSSYVPEILNDGHVEVAERVVVSSDGYVRATYHVYKDTWLVFHDGDGVYVMTDEALNQRYEPANSDGR